MNIDPQAPLLPEAADSDGEQQRKSGSCARVKRPAPEPTPTWTDADIAKAKNALLRNLNATKRFFDRDAKAYVDVPDPMAQISAAIAICNQAIGLPVQRQIRIQQTFSDRNSELLEIAKTAHGREMLLAMGAIDQAWLKKNLPAESAALSINPQRTPDGPQS